LAAAWRILAEAELCDYLKYTLNQHGLPDDWSASATSLVAHHLETLALAKLRYVYWASMTAAASTYLKTNGHLGATRRHLENALAKRASTLTQDSSVGINFRPFPSLKMPLVLDGLLSTFPEFRDHYWTVPPTSESVAMLAGA